MNLSQRLRELLSKANTGKWESEGGIIYTPTITYQLAQTHSPLICELVNNAPTIIAALEAAEKEQA